MAKIGLKYPVYKGSVNKGVIGKAIQADIAITVNEVYLPADDAIAESDKSFQSGKITLGIDDLSDTVQVEFLGHTMNVSGEISAKGTDNNPYVGIGFYAIKKVNNVQKFRAVWFPKVQFAEPNDTNNTKGQNVAFATPTLEGTIMLDDNGDWKKEQTFDTEAEARAYLQDKAGITDKCTTPASSLASGSYTAAQAQDIALTAGAGEAIYYTTNGTTPSAVNGTLYSTPIDVTASLAIKAVATKSGSSNSDIATYEYIITA
jgi:phi13 family phage major tail protein